MDIQNPEDIIRGRANQALRQMRGTIGPIIAGVLLLAMLGTSIYTIGPDEVGVITRFGRYIRQTEPGLHFRMPLFVERVIPVKVRHVYKEEFGYRTGENRRRGLTREGRQNEALMLTGDLNVLEVRWIVQFQIKNPTDFLFNIRNQQEVIRDMSEVVMRSQVGDYSVDEVLTTKRAEIDVEAQQHLQEILDSYGAGVKIVTIKLQDVTPPDSVKPAFNQVNEARQEKERMINQAWETYNRAVPRAKGEAEKTIREAEGYALDVVNRAEGEAKRFTATWKAYKRSPKVTRQRLYLDTLAEVLPKAKAKYIIDADQKGVLPLLQLNGNGGGAS